MSPTESITRIMESIDKNGSCVRRLGDKREVWRVGCGSRVFYVKRSFYRGWVQRILTLFRRTGTRREADLIGELHERGIPVPTLVATGVERSGGLITGEYIITEEVAGSESLRDFFFTTFRKLPRAEKKKAVEDFAVFIRRLHDSGVVHKDLHMGNVLIGRDRDRYGFHLLDLNEVELKSGITLAQRWENLVLVNINFINNVEDSLRFHFLKHYSSGLLNGREELRKVAAEIEKGSLSLASSVWKKKAKRCMGTNRLFVATRYGGLRVNLKRDWDGVEGLSRVIASPDAFLDGGDSVIYKDGRTVKAAMVELDGGGKVFLKRYNRKGAFHTLKNVFRSSRARKVWQKGYAAELRGLRIPAPVALIEERRFRLLLRSYVITEFIDDATRLNDFVEQGMKERVDCGVLMHALGREIGGMHRLGWFHGDLKWNNILVGPGTVFWFLDIDGSMVKGGLTDADVAKDLGRFMRDMDKSPLGKEEKIRFIHGYLARNPSSSRAVLRLLEGAVQ